MNTRKRAQQARPTGSAADQSTGENEAFAAKTRPLVGKKPKSAAVATNNNIAVAAASIINTPVTTAAAAATATTSIIPTSTADRTLPSTMTNEFLSSHKLHGTLTSTLRRREPA